MTEAALNFLLPATSSCPSTCYGPTTRCLQCPVPANSLQAFRALVDGVYSCSPPMTEGGSCRYRTPRVVNKRSAGYFPSQRTTRADGAGFMTSERTLVSRIIIC